MAELSHSHTHQRQELTTSGFSALLEAAADSIIIIDDRGEILNFNSAAEKLFGYTVEEILKKNVSMLMPEPYSSEHDKYLIDYVSTRVAKIIGIGRKVEGRRKDGTVFPMELSVGEYVEVDRYYFVGIIRDLTDREAVENALKDSQEQLREREQALEVTLNNAPIGIITLDLDGRLLGANYAATQLVGYSELEIMGTDYIRILHPEDVEATEVRRHELLGGEGSSFSLDTRLIDKQGDIIYVVFHCRIVFAQDDKPGKFVAQLVDRSDQVKAELEAQEARNRLAQVDRISTMGEMASGIAHEINQPLSAISTYVQACLRRLDSSPVDENKLRELLAKTDQQSRRAGTIVQRIRSLTQPHDIHRDRMDINTIVADTIHLAKADTNSWGFLLGVELMHKSGEVIADGVQIQQVILNLVRNAVDAAEEAGSDSRRIQLGTKMAKGDDYVEVWVRDYGVGIPEEVRGQIFEPFVTSKKKGTGMGLSISRSIVNAHGGELWAEPMTPGTRFHFTIPMAVGADDESS